MWPNIRGIFIYPNGAKITVHPYQYTFINVKSIFEDDLSFDYTRSAVESADSCSALSTVIGKREFSNESQDSKQQSYKKAKEISCSCSSSSSSFFDIIDSFNEDHFVSELHFLNCTDLDSFRKFFNEAVKAKPELTELMIEKVLMLENLDMILLLYQEGYKINFPGEAFKKRLLSKAFEEEKMELIEFLLSSPRIIDDFPKREDELVRKVSDYRRISFNRFIKHSFTIGITADRSKIFQSAYGMVLQNENLWYSGDVRPFIIFDAEAGIDHGGLTHEWIQLLLESFLKPDEERILKEQYFHSRNQSSSCTSSSNTKTLELFDCTEAFFLESSSQIT